MSINPLERFVPIAEVEEPTWEYDYGISTQSLDTVRAQMQKKLRPMGMVVIAFFAVLFIRLFTLQIAEGETYRLAAEGNSIRTIEIPAPRGLIIDRDGSPIVKNIAGFSVDLIPAYLPPESSERGNILTVVARETGVSIDMDQLEKAGLSLERIPVIANLSYDQALLMEIKLANLPGVAVTKRPQREYRDLPGVGHLLGYIGTISREELSVAQNRGDSRYGYTSVVGKAGLEFTYEEVLKGLDGKTQLEVDARGKRIRQLASIAPLPGNTVRLYLADSVQEALSRALSEAVKRAGSKAGAALAIDPQTGGILGLSSIPSFEPEIFSPGHDKKLVENLLSHPDHPFVNRPISGVYPPGSTIKPLWAAAALEEETISRATKVTSVGGFNIGEFSFKDWKAGGHGLTDVKKALAESVNTFFYAVTGGYENVPGLGIDRLKKYASLFGIGDKTGIDLPGERTGFFPDPDWKKRTRGEGWFLGNTYQLGIGQGDVLVTPVEMLMAMNAIVNGGELLQPQVVQAVISPSGEILHQSEKKVIRSNFIKPEHLQVVKEGMRTAVESGSARFLNDLPVPAGGKTGTAQYASNKKTHAWFFGFAPYDDPKIAIIVIIEGGGEGTTAAAPVAKEVFRVYFSSP